MTVDAARQLELEQRGLHVRRRCIALADQFVNRERLRPERGQRRRSASGAGAARAARSRALRAGGRRPRHACGARRRWPAGSGSGARIAQHVGGALDQVRAVAQQLVGAAMARVERAARHRHHLAALLGRQPRGDQRARLRRRLDHHHAERQAGDHPVAAREVAWPAATAPERPLADHGTALRRSAPSGRRSRGG